MPVLHLIILAIIQGITEFLPISSSAHLIILPATAGVEDPGPLVDVAVHLGTLIAVLAYFRVEAARVYRGAFGIMRGSITTNDESLTLCLLTGTIPVILLGIIFKGVGLDITLRDELGLIGIMMLVFGILLWWADSKSYSIKTAEEWTLKQALILGLWQAIALIPGTSRSGIIITGARFMGFNREDAARISMLMSIPVIIAASTLSALEAVRVDNFGALRAGAVAAFFSAVSAYITLHLMMNWIKKISFTPYVIYRVIFGALLIWWAYA